MKLNKEDIDRLSGTYPDLIRISDMPQRAYQIIQKRAELKNIEHGLISIDSELEQTESGKKYTPSGSEVKRLIKLKKSYERDIQKLKHEIESS